MSLGWNLSPLCSAEPGHALVHVSDRPKGTCCNSICHYSVVVGCFLSANERTLKLLTVIISCSHVMAP